MTIEPQTGEGGQPQPFSETPGPAPGGCSRPLLVGCGAAVVLLGLLLLGVLWKASDFMPALFRWSLDQFERQIAGSLPAELSEGERQRLAEAFESAATAVEDGTVEQLTREEVLGLTEALEAVAGQRAPPPASEGRPEAGPAAPPLAV